MKASTRKKQEKDQAERDHRSARDPLQVIRREWIESEDRMTRMLGYIADAHSPAAARLRADPSYPITKSELDRWLMDPEHTDLYLTAEDFGEAKLTDGLRAQALNMESSRKGSHVATQVMMRVIGRTPAQIQRTANEKPKEDLRYIPPDELGELTDEELARL